MLLKSLSGLTKKSVPTTTEAQPTTPEAPKTEAPKEDSLIGIPEAIKPMKVQSKAYEDRIDLSKIDNDKLEKAMPHVRRIASVPDFKSLSNEDRRSFDSMYRRVTNGHRMFDLAKEKSAYEPGEKALMAEDFIGHIRNNADLKSALEKVAEETGFKTTGTDENLADFLVNVGPKTLNKIQEAFYDRAYKRVFETLFAGNEKSSHPKSAFEQEYGEKEEKSFPVAKHIDYHPKPKATGGDKPLNLKDMYKYY